jgi:hypothetical protein
MIRHVYLASALVLVSVPALGQGQLARCLHIFGHEALQGGGAFSVRNNCDQCVKFNPLVKHSSGKSTYASTAGVLGQPITSVSLAPSLVQRLSYGHGFGAGDYTPIANNPRTCN